MFQKKRTLTIMALTRHVCMSVVLLAGIAYLQYAVEKQNLHSADLPLTPLPASIIRFIDLGLHDAAASFFWLHTIQEVGGIGPGPMLAHNINLINDLDPQFSYPYAFATLILPAIQNIDDAIAIGQRGLAQAEPNWQIPYYMAIIYHTSYQDRQRAAFYLDLAAHTSGAPENIIKIVANYGSQPNKREQTKQIWLGIYENSRDEIAQARAKSYIIHFELLDILDKAIQQYKAKTRKNPHNLDDLVRAHVLKQIPIDPLGLTYDIDDKGKLITH